MLIIKLDLRKTRMKICPVGSSTKFSHMSCSRVVQCCSFTISIVRAAEEGRSKWLVHNWCSFEWPNSLVCNSRLDDLHMRIGQDGSSTMAYICVSNEAERERFICYIVHMNCIWGHLLGCTSRNDIITYMRF